MKESKEWTKSDHEWRVFILISERNEDKWAKRTRASFHLIKTHTPGTQWLISFTKGLNLTQLNRASFILFSHSLRYV